MIMIRSGLKSNIVKALLLIGPSIPASAWAATATYEVPKGALLDSALVVDMNRVHFRVRGSDIASLDYELPPELDGTTPHRFRLTGTMTNGEWHLSTGDSANQNGDPTAVATCTGTRDFTCVMNYAKNDQGVFPLNIESANNYLSTRPDLTPEQINHIQSAQVALSQEPIGIIRGRR